MKPPSPWEEHAAGWDILENEVKLFSLEFIENDMWYYRFKVIDFNCPQERLIEILNSAGRQPIEGLVYKNRLSQCVVPNEMFCGGYHGDGVAVIRDFRPPTKWWSGVGTLPVLFVLCVMLIIIVFLLIVEYRTT